MDLDADHMVSDLVSWERMVQRLGRVNRRGDGDASVIVAVNTKPSKAVQDAISKKPSDRTEKESKAVAKHEAMIESVRVQLKPVEQLPQENGVFDASPGAIRAETHGWVQSGLAGYPRCCNDVCPASPTLSRALVDAWSLTSLKKHTGRPEIAPWLRGWVDDKPQTSVVWRTRLPVRLNGEGKAEGVPGIL